MYIVYARLLLVQGRLADARRWLARLEGFLIERGIYRWLITVHILQALTADRSGDRPSAVELLARAIEIAAPEGYSRAFLNEDRRLFALLPDVRDVAPAFVGQLLTYDDAPVETPAAVQPLVEPLSDRELEVLRLIAAGLANREIADELVIAVGTVKRHINHIYGKLGVGSRTQAIAKARELRLLG
jgi:LuxR family maltose regulon positive regulatory protein